MNLERVSESEYGTVGVSRRWEAVGLAGRWVGRRDVVPFFASRNAVGTGPRLRLICMLSLVVY